MRLAEAGRRRWRPHRALKVTPCRLAISLFGPDRTMFAGNFPVASLFSSLADLYALYATCVADRTDEERRTLFAGNAARIYGPAAPTAHSTED